MKQTLSWRATMVPTLSLFTSLGTLVCCALPALLVSLGMGAVMAGLVTTLPALTVLGTYKVTVFAVAGGLLLLSSVLQYSQRNAPCPADAKQAVACRRLRKISLFLTLFSWLVYGIGFFFAFLAAKLLF